MSTRHSIRTACQTSSRPPDRLPCYPAALPGACVELTRDAAGSLLDAAKEPGMSTHVRRHPNTSSPDRSIPVTREALARVEAEAVRLDASLAAARAEARRTGVMGDHNAPTVLAAGELHLVLSRLRALQEILAAARVVESDGVAALGSRVTVRDAAGE